MHNACMKIGIDAHVLGTRAGGNETYMNNLLRALQQHPPPFDISAFVGVDQENAVRQQYGIQTIPLTVHSSYLRVPLVLPWLCRREKIDLLHVQYTAPPVSSCPYIVSLHDIVSFKYPDSMPFLDRNRLRLLTGHTVRHARRIWVLTEAMRDEISDYFHIDPNKFDLVQPVPDPAFVPVVDTEHLQAVRARYGLPGHYILFLGLLQPRKNLLRLAQAFKQLRDQGLEHVLVVVGKKAWLYGPMLQEIEALELGDSLIFTGYAEHADLPALFSGADCFAYVSLYEGFGIPVLEALACGTPVLASQDPALREVTGGAAVHVDARSVDAIAAGLRTVLEDEALRKNLRDKGLTRARAFTLEGMAHAAISGYQKALGV